MARSRPESASVISAPSKVGSLTIRLLGPNNITFDGRPLGTDSGKPIPDKTAALLNYLAVEAQPVPRATVSELLWPGNRDANLRVAISQIRRLRGARSWWQDSSNLAVNATVDLFAFEQAVAQRDYNLALQLWGDSADPQHHLLADLQLQKFPEDFQVWLESLREDAFRCYLEALYLGSLDLEAQGELQRAQMFALELIDHNPFHEAGHQQVMRLLLRDGDPTGAIVHFEDFRRSLQSEALPPPLQETTHLFRQAQKALVAKQHVRKNSISAFRSQLMDHPNQFVGREVESALLLATLRKPRQKLVTLLGPGGAGKTRLAIEAASKAAEQYPGGVVFVPLDGIGDAQHLLQALAHALGLAHDSQQLAEVKDRLQARSYLLVLDTFEHLLESATTVNELVTASAGSILVTSRAPLRLRREETYTVLGLPFPQYPHDPRFEEHAAVRFFLQCARRSHQDFTLDPEHQEPFLRICRFVNGMPLYLEHLASWIRLLSIPEIAQELEAGLELFTWSHLDLPKRHRRLDLVLEQSWNRLPHGAQKAFASLSLFRGGFTRSAAREVAESTLGDLRLLHERAFLHTSNSRRFELLDTHRHFAANKLSENPGLMAAALARRATHFQGLVHEAQRGLTGADLKQWLAVLDADLDNIRALLGWAMEERHAGLGLDITSKLAAYWEYRNLHHEASGYLDAFLGAYRGHDELRAASLRTASCLHQSCGNMRRSEELNDEAIKLFKELGNMRGLSTVLVRAGVIHAQRGDLRKAVSYFQECLTIEDALGDESGASVALLNIGIALTDLRDYERAWDYLGRAQTLKCRISDEYGIVLTTLSLASLATELGRLNEAESLLEKAIAHCDDLGLTAEKAHALIALGWLWTSRDDLHQSERLLQEGLRLARDSEDLASESQALAHLGTVARLRGDRETALRWYRKAWPLQLQMEDATAILGTVVNCLLVAAEGEHWFLVASLLGAVEAYEANIGKRLTTEDRSNIETHYARSERALGQAAARKARKAGKASLLEDTVAAGLQFLSEPGRNEQ